MPFSLRPVIYFAVQIKKKRHFGFVSLLWLWWSLLLLMLVMLLL